MIPALSEASENMLANAYVFTNGVKGAGPVGYQPDVFESPPETGGYRPLRRVNKVTWRDTSATRVLMSAGDVMEAGVASELRVEPTQVVVNMPKLTWPGRQR